jgi:hypothetical protein
LFSTRSWAKGSTSITEPSSASAFLARRPHGVSHIVQAVEEGNEVVPVQGVVFRARHLEANAVVHACPARIFPGRRDFPKVKLRLEEVLVATGKRKEFVMSGASASWHDLVLYLIARQVGPTAAQAIRRFMLLQWHVDGRGLTSPLHRRSITGTPQC